MTAKKRNIKINYGKITIKNDFMFSSVMSNSRRCKKALSILLNKKVIKIKYVEEQKSIELKHDSKSVRLDIYVEDEETIYNVEMQLCDKRNLLKRARYYSELIDLNTTKKGVKYNELKNLYVIFICDFDYFKKGLPQYTSKIICEECETVSMENGVKLIVFNILEYSKIQRDDLKFLLEYIGTGIAMDNFTKLLEKDVEKLRDNVEWRREYMNFYLKQQDLLDDTKEAGIRIGEKKGEKKGERKQNIIIAKRMFKKQTNIDFIQEITGLTKKELLKLRASVK